MGIQGKVPARFSSSSLLFIFSPSWTSTFACVKTKNVAGGRAGGSAWGVIIGGFGARSRPDPTRNKHPRKELWSSCRYPWKPRNSKKIMDKEAAGDGDWLGETVGCWGGIGELMVY